MSLDLDGAVETDRPLLTLLRDAGSDHVGYFAFGMLAEVVAAVLDRLDVFVLGLAFDAMFNDRPYALPLVPDGVIPEAQLPQLWFTVGLLLALKGNDIAAALSSRWGTGVFAQRTLDSARVSAFESVQRLEMGFFDDHQTGEVMSVCNNDVNTLEEFLSRGAPFALRTVVTFGTAVGLMVVLNWQLAVFALVTAPVVAGLNRWLSTLRERLQDAVRSETGDLNARIETSLGGIDVVKAFAGESRESERVAAASRDHFRARWGARKAAAAHPPTMRLVSGTALTATFVVGAIWVVDGPPLWFSGRLTAGELIPFLIYMQTLTNPMKWLAFVVGFHSEAAAAAKRILGLQHLEDRREDRTGHRLDDPEGRVSYQDVRFSYPGTEEAVLDGVDLTAEPGDTVGLVGTTGAGKSTLIKLLCRFYDVDAGAVSVDGHDVRDLEPRSLRRSIGYVAQDPFLFDGTIRENVACGHPDADEAAVGRAAAEAGVDEFVDDLEDGYDTEVGERGSKLSGGQRQRIAIARAILGDPAVLVFDEATSHVDNETEALVQARLDELTADRTTFVVAHRLSTVRNADRIAVLDDGRVVESGTHDDLLERDGTYANLWNVQIGNVEALPDEFVANATAAVETDDD